MRCWKAADLECGGVYKGHRYPIWCMDESPVGMYLVTGSKDRTARLWSIETKFPLITFIGHTQDIEVSTTLLQKFFILLLVVVVVHQINVIIPLIVRILKILYS